jgi:hypothetical protein
MSSPAMCKLSKRSGAQSVWLCPFTQRKDALLLRVAGKQIYHCFGSARAAASSTSSGDRGLSFPRRWSSGPPGGHGDPPGPARRRVLSAGSGCCPSTGRAPASSTRRSCPPGRIAQDYSTVVRSGAKMVAPLAWLRPDSWDSLLKAMHGKATRTKRCFDARLVRAGKKARQLLRHLPQPPHVPVILSGATS